MSLEHRKNVVVEKVRVEMGKRNISISKSTIIGIMRITMEVIENEPVKGKTQKELAISVVGDIVDNSSMDDESKRICRIIIDTGVLSDTIDTVVDATRGRLNINKVRSLSARCCEACTRIIGRR